MKVYKAYAIICALALPLAHAQEDSVVTTTNQSPSQKVLILNNQPVNQQPTTYVEATPLSESRADVLRRQRQDMEVQTEQKIVEKLENSRLEDEKSRADKLFGNKLQEETPVVVAPAPVAVVPVQEKAEVPSEQLESVKAEIISTIKEQKEEEKKPESQMYFAGLMGTTEYPDVSNVEGNYAFGFSVGTIMPNRIVVEGSFLYSNYYVDEFWSINPFKELDQYNTSLAVKYAFLPGRFRPMVGVLAGYTYRQYSNRQFNNYYYRNLGYNDQETDTHAVDVGVTVGADFDVTESLSIGAEYRYSTNMINKSDDDIWYQEFLAPGNSTPVEELDYSSFTINAKFKF